MKELNVPGILCVFAVLALLTLLTIGAVAVVNRPMPYNGSMAVVKQLEIAVVAYRTTYDTLPFTLELETDRDAITVDYNEDGVFAGSVDPGSAPNGDSFYAKLLACLSAEAERYPPGVDYNPRRQKFLELDKNNEYKDHWGRDYIVVLDLDGNDEIAPPYAIGERSALRRNILVFSAGPDGLYDPKNPGAATNRDNIRSWDR